MITDKVKADGKTWLFTLTADRVLGALALLEQENILPEVKTAQAARLLVRGRVSAADVPKAVELAFQTARGDETQPTQAGLQAISFVQDWGYISAAFLQAYGIDLEKNLSKMHWKKFVDLLRSVPDETRLSKIMDIRTMPLPKPTKYNAEERARLSRLKAQYAIKKTQTGVEDGLRGLYDVLSVRAKKAGD